MVSACLAVPIPSLLSLPLFPSCHHPPSAPHTHTLSLSHSYSLGCLSEGSCCCVRLPALVPHHHRHDCCSSLADALVNAFASLYCFHIRCRAIDPKMLSLLPSCASASLFLSLPLIRRRVSMHDCSSRRRLVNLSSNTVHAFPFPFIACTHAAFPPDVSLSLSCSGVQVIGLFFHQINFKEEDLTL